jgi:hypothetical protein
MMQPTSRFHFEYEFKGVSKKTGDDVFITGTLVANSYAEFLESLHASMLREITQVCYFK